jgi:hypothetical protein
MKIDHVKSGKRFRAAIEKVSKVLNTEFKDLTEIQKVWVCEVLTHRFRGGPIWLSLRDDYEDVYREGVSVGDWFGE